MHALNDGCGPSLIGKARKGRRCPGLEDLDSSIQGRYIYWRNSGGRHHWSCIVCFAFFALGHSFSSPIITQSLFAFQLHSSSPPWIAARPPLRPAASGERRPPLLSAPPVLHPMAVGMESVDSSGDGSLCRSHYCSLAFFGLPFSVIPNVHVNPSIYTWGQVVFLPAMVFPAPFLFSPSPSDDITRIPHATSEFRPGSVIGSLW